MHECGCLYNREERGNDSNDTTRYTQYRTAPPLTVVLQRSRGASTCDSIRGGAPDNGQEGQNKKVQIELDQRVRGERIEVGFFTKKAIGNEGGQKNEMRVL
jgi:hypothetical protein